MSFVKQQQAQHDFKGRYITNKMKCSHSQNVTYSIPLLSGLIKKPIVEIIVPISAKTTVTNQYRRSIQMKGS